MEPGNVESENIGRGNGHHGDRQTALVLISLKG
jgi:hypothetical protein